VILLGKVDLGDELGAQGEEGLQHDEASFAISWV
jgi:hypothetical protein